MRLPHPRTGPVDSGLFYPGGAGSSESSICHCRSIATGAVGTTISTSWTANLESDLAHWSFDLTQYICESESGHAARAPRIDQRERPNSGRDWAVDVPIGSFQIATTRSVERLTMPTPSIFLLE